MKISDITIEDLKKYANVFHDEDDDLFDSILTSCKSYIKGYTGLDDVQMDDREELSIAIYVLSNELYDNRMFTVDKNKVNFVVNSILSMHSFNLI